MKREDQRHVPGTVRPVVNPALCEGKAICVLGCPADVFQIARIPQETFNALPTLAKFKVFVHGMKTALTPNAEDCLGCGYCVSACPEHAIRLELTNRQPPC